MSDWDGTDRRSKNRSKDDLDFTWQDAFFSMRREFHAHVEHNAQQEDLRVKHYAVLDAKMDDILEIKAQIAGAMRVLGLLGATIAAMFSFLVTFWDKIIDFLGTHK